MTIHLHPTAEPCERALLPGDPGRALQLAQSLLEKPQMFNHNRGLWGYVGPASDGEPLLIQATGIGGPSAAIVLEELASLGVRRAVRVGTCGALDPSLAFGDLVVARSALAADGTSRALGAGEEVLADAALAGALEGRTGLIVTTDVFYDDRAGLEDSWRAAGALAVEMETAALLQVGLRRDVAVASLLAVTDLLAHRPDRQRISEDGLREAGEKLGVVAARALGA